MQHRTPSCQLAHANRGVSRGISTPCDGTQGQATGTDTFRTAPAQQWVSTTTGRIVTDGHSWMTAVHWVADPKHKRYSPSRNHGPRRMNNTTLLIAQELANLLECRPGVDYLARKTKTSERTVEYHLDMLRESGLLTYISKGTRVARGVNQASVYERTIPVAFDDALGVRTAGEGVQRRAVGIAEEGRKLIGKLAKRAARKVRRRTPKTAVSGQGRCTLMEGGTSASSSTGASIPPSETGLASGSSSHPTQKKATRGPQKLNKVGRRYQLAAELITNVAWLQNASTPRISWIARHCADAGWTWQEVQAAAEESNPIDPADTRRPSGLLAHRLKGVHQLYADPISRELMVVAWEDSRAQERFRHTGWDQVAIPAADSPVALEAQRAIAAVFEPALTEEGETYEAGAIDIEALTRQEVLAHRDFAAADPQYAAGLLDALGNRDARRLLTHRIVDQALTLLRLAPTTANAF